MAGAHCLPTGSPMVSCGRPPNRHHGRDSGMRRLSGWRKVVMMTDDLMAKALRYRWIIFWILACGYVLVYFHRLCPAVVAVDMMGDLAAGGTLLGILGSAYFYPYAVMQLPAGLLADSWGPRRTITLFFTVAFAGSLLLGLAPSVFWAVVGRTLVGLGVSMLFVPTMKILAEWFKAGEFAFMTGILMAMGGIGSLSAATPLALLSAWLGWRLSFVAVGVFTLVLAVLVWIVVRDRPADLGWPSPSAPAAASGAPIGLVQGVRRVLATFYFWPLAVWFFFDCAIFFFVRRTLGRSLSHPGLRSEQSRGRPGSVHDGHRYDRWQPAAELCLQQCLPCPKTGTRDLQRRCLRPDGSAGILYGSHACSDAVSALPWDWGFFPVPWWSSGLRRPRSFSLFRSPVRPSDWSNLFPFAGGAVFQPFLGFILEHQGRAGGHFTLGGYQQAFMALFVCGILAMSASLFLKETVCQDSMTFQWVTESVWYAGGGRQMKNQPGKANLNHPERRYPKRGHPERRRGSPVQAPDRRGPAGLCAGFTSDWPRPFAGYLKEDPLRSGGGSQMDPEPGGGQSLFGFGYLREPDRGPCQVC